jgi:hypothetical protein
VDGADFSVDQIWVNIVLCDGVCDGFEARPLVGLVTCIDVEVELVASIGGQQFFPGVDWDGYAWCSADDIDGVAGCRIYFDEVLSSRLFDEEV